MVEFRNGQAGQLHLQPRASLHFMLFKFLYLIETWQNFVDSYTDDRDVLRCPFLFRFFVLENYTSLMIVTMSCTF